MAPSIWLTQWEDAVMDYMYTHSDSHQWSWLDRRVNGHPPGIALWRRRWGWSPAEWRSSPGTEWQSRSVHGSQHTLISNTVSEKERKNSIIYNNDKHYTTKTTRKPTHMLSKENMMDNNEHPKWESSELSLQYIRLNFSRIQFIQQV